VAHVFWRGKAPWVLVRGDNGQAFAVPWAATDLPARKGIALSDLGLSDIAAERRQALVGRGALAHPGHLQQCIEALGIALLLGAEQFPVVGIRRAVLVHVILGLGIEILQPILIGGVEPVPVILARKPYRIPLQGIEHIPGDRAGLPGSAVLDRVAGLLQLVIVAGRLLELLYCVGIARIGNIEGCRLQLGDVVSQRLHLAQNGILPERPVRVILTDDVPKALESVVRAFVPL